MCGFCELLFWGGGKYLELQLGGLRRQNGGPRLLPSLPWGRGTQRRAAGLGLVGGGKLTWSHKLSSVTVDLGACRAQRFWCRLPAGTTVLLRYSKKQTINLKKKKISKQ